MRRRSSPLFFLCPQPTAIVFVRYRNGGLCCVRTYIFMYEDRLTIGTKQSAVLCKATVTGYCSSRTRKANRTYLCDGSLFFFLFV